MNIDPIDFLAAGQRHQQSKQLNELNKELQRQKEKERRAPKCPACGGALPGEFRKCKHCGTELIWLEGIVKEKGKEKELEAAVIEKQAAVIEKRDRLAEQQSKRRKTREDVKRRKKTSSRRNKSNYIFLLFILGIPLLVAIAILLLIDFG